QPGGEPAPARRGARCRARARRRASRTGGVVAQAHGAAAPERRRVAPARGFAPPSGRRRRPLARRSGAGGSGERAAGDGPSGSTNRSVEGRATPGADDRAVTQRRRISVLMTTEGTYPHSSGG